MGNLYIDLLFFTCLVGCFLYVYSYKFYSFCMIKYYNLQSWYLLRKIRFKFWLHGKSHILRNKSDKRIKNEMMYGALMARRDILGIEPDGKILTQIVRDLRNPTC